MTIKLGGIPQLIWKLKSRIRRVALRGLENGSKKLAPDYSRRIRMGIGASGRALRPVKNSTMDMPIRMGGPDRRIRRSVNNSKIPIVATGKTANSISAKKKTQEEWEVSANNSKSDMILAVNAKVSPSDNIKLARDPLQVAKPQLDLVEKEILKEIDRLFI